MNQNNIVPLFKGSLRDAKIDRCTKEWAESYEENVSCRSTLEQLLWNGSIVGNNPQYNLSTLTDVFGYDRLSWILAATVQSAPDAYSQECKEWTKNFYVPDLKEHNDFILDEDIDPSLIEKMVQKMERYFQEQGLFSKEQCLPKNDDINYKGQVLVVSPFSLAEQERTPENQLVLATGGFGCNPKSDGKIFVTCLYDGQHDYFRRSDIEGILQEEQMPDWVRTALQELQEEQNIEQDDSPVMG